ncbi:MAG: DUF2513 domain-containing protein [Planctomycetaceae bacterium]|jgi:hypothetical protein|nr:DUF2513 domain-containing protein [Planctomycetaceae bacterium]
MKRDNDLIRDILLFVEQHGDNNNVLTLSVRDFFKSSPNVTQNILDNHIELLTERKFLKAEPHQLGWFVLGLTWDGHDFLSNAKDQTIWSKSKQLAGHLSFDIFATVIKDIALNITRSVVDCG